MKKRTPKQKGTEERGLIRKLRDSPINYFSDLFIVAMVAAWIIVLLIMLIMAAYATFHLADTSMWSDVSTLAAMPLSAGGAIWMIKNSVQHAIANRSGKLAHMDFPKVNADGEDDGSEVLMEMESNPSEERSEESYG